MELVRKYAYSDFLRKPLSISDAVEITCHDDRDGVLETARASQEATAEFLGKLVTKLHDKGLFSDTDVLDLLSDFDLRKD